MLNSTKYNENEKIWYGPKETRVMPNPSIGKILLNALEQDPDRIVQVQK